MRVGVFVIECIVKSKKNMKLYQFCNYFNFFLWSTVFLCYICGTIKIKATKTINYYTYYYERFERNKD